MKMKCPKLKEKSSFKKSKQATWDDFDSSSNSGSETNEDRSSVVDVSHTSRT